MTNEIEISGYKQSEIDKIKAVLGTNMSNVELEIFLHICKHTGLDPIRRQIYAIPRGGKVTFQTSIDGARLIAERTGCYAPGRASEFYYDDNGRLISATSFVKKLAGGIWHEVGETALWAEYVGNTPFWKKMPTVMLSKVAEMRALRRAFPDDLSGLFSEDEMDQAERKEIAQLPEVDDPIISQEDWEKLDTFINGNKDLRINLKKICKVDDLRNIRQSQKEACNGYVKACIERSKNNTNK